jgi:glutamate dehydrogenase (NAD(P)+)
MDPFQLSDEFGPHEVIHLCEPAQSLRAIVVIDNVALGPALGPVSFAPGRTLEQLVQGARHSTLMHAAASLPHGGARAVVLASRDLERHRKRTLLRCLASALRDRRDFIATPGEGTDEECMGWMLDEGLRVAGRPRELGGTPLRQSEAIGLGLAEAVQAAVEYCDVELRGARVVLSGFDAAARQSARYLADAGAAIIAVADASGAIHEPNGLNVYELASRAEDGHSVIEQPGLKPISSEAFVGIDCDIRIEAAEGGITASHADEVRARLVVEGCRLAVPLEVEVALHRRGVACLPALIASVGGAVAQSFELRGAPSQSLAEAIRQQIMGNTRAVLGDSSRPRRLPSEVARALALEPLEKAIAARRWSSFAGTDCPGSDWRDPRAAYEA